MNIFGISYNNNHVSTKNERRIKEFGIDQIQDLFEFLGHPVDIRHRIFMTSLWEHFNVEKDELLVKKGEMNKSIFFIISGALRFHTDTNGDDKTFLILNEGNFALSSSCFNRNQNSIIYISACQNTHILEMNLSNYNKYANSIYSIDLEQIVKKLMGRFDIYQHEINVLLRLCCQERVRGLYKLDSSLFQSVSGKHIAALLNIKSETLSRAKNYLRNSNINQH